MSCRALQQHLVAQQLQGSSELLAVTDLMWTAGKSLKKILTWLKTTLEPGQNSLCDSANAVEQSALSGDDDEYVMEALTQASSPDFHDRIEWLASKFKGLTAQKVRSELLRNKHCNCDAQLMHLRCLTGDRRNVASGVVRFHPASLVNSYMAFYEVLYFAVGEQRRGFGTQFHEKLQTYASHVWLPSAGGRRGACAMIFGVLHASKEAEPFWNAMGFKPAGQLGGRMALSASVLLSQCCPMQGATFMLKVLKGITAEAKHNSSNSSCSSLSTT